MYLLRNTTLAAAGRNHRLDGFVDILNPIQPDNLKERHMADAMEAILAAVYLDTRKDIEAVKAVMRTLGLDVPVLDWSRSARIVENAPDQLSLTGIIPSPSLALVAVPRIPYIPPRT